MQVTSNSALEIIQEIKNIAHSGAVDPKYLVQRLEELESYFGYLVQDSIRMAAIENIVADADSGDRDNWADAFEKIKGVIG